MITFRFIQHRLYIDKLLKYCFHLVPESLRISYHTTSDTYSPTYSIAFFVSPPFSSISGPINSMIESPYSLHAFINSLGVILLTSDVKFYTLCSLFSSLTALTAFDNFLNKLAGLTSARSSA